MVSCEMAEQVRLLINLSVSGDLPARLLVLAPKWLSGKLPRFRLVWPAVPFLSVKERIRTSPINSGNATLIALPDCVLTAS